MPKTGYNISFLVLCFCFYQACIYSSHLTGALKTFNIDHHPVKRLASRRHSIAFLHSVEEASWVVCVLHYHCIGVACHITSMMASACSCAGVWDLPHRVHIYVCGRVWLCLCRCVCVGGGGGMCARFYHQFLFTRALSVRTPVFKMMWLFGCPATAMDLHTKHV